MLPSHPAAAATSPNRPESSSYSATLPIPQSGSALGSNAPKKKGPAVTPRRRGGGGTGGNDAAATKNQHKLIASLVNSVNSSNNNTNDKNYAEAMYDYEARTDLEHSIAVGERLLLVTRDTGDGWAEVDKGGVVKSVPANYIKDVLH